MSLTIFRYWSKKHGVYWYWSGTWYLSTLSLAIGICIRRKLMENGWTTFIPCTLQSCGIVSE